MQQETSNKIIEKTRDFFYGIGFFSEFILFILVFVILFILPSYSHIDLLFFIIGFSLCILLNGVLKRSIKEPRPDNTIKFLQAEKLKKNSYGMPSGHSQNVFFCIVYLYLTLYKFFPYVFTSCLVAISMLFQRFLFHNHTAHQLVSGALVGSVLAIIVVYAREQIKHRYITPNTTITTKKTIKNSTSSPTTTTTTTTAKNSHDNI